METTSELYNIEKMPHETFTIYLKLIESYQKEDPILSEKLKCTDYKKGYFRGGWNTIKLVTYKNKIVIPQKLQKYVVK